MTVGRHFLTTRGAAVLLICVAIGVLFDPAAVASGWLVGFCFWSQVLIGSLVLLMIHRLTGGRWGEIAAPVLLPAARAIPVLLPLALPVFLAVPLLYPWSHHPAEIKPDVLARYLNIPFFVIRSLIALGGWAALSIVVPRSAGIRGQYIAAIGLVFHAIAVSTVPIDWYLSMDAPFTSSSFGASVAVVQFTAAMAWVGVVGPESESGGNIADLGALLLAFVLGITYIDFMAVLVIWYGDLPYEEIWFVTRSPWLPLGVGAFLLVSVVPVFSLFRSDVRASRTALRVLGASVLIGLACYDAYLICPNFGVMSLVWALATTLGIGCALAGWMFADATALRAERLSHAR